MRIKGIEENQGYNWKVGATYYVKWEE